MQNLLLKNSYGRIRNIFLENNMLGLSIEYEYGYALISLHGGQLLKWQPKNQQPIFWLSKDAYYQKNKAIRGGIPICWPWFGQHEKDIDNSAINHGFARLNTWKIDTVECDEQQVRIVLSLQGNNEHALFSSAFKLTQTFIFSNHAESTFEHSLSMSNLSSDAVFYTGALHSYFAVSKPENTTIKILESLPFDDMLTGKHCTAQPLENCVGSIDRNYQIDDTNEKNSITHTTVIEDSGWQRKIEITAKHSQQWILWNPGIEIAKNMADIHKNGEHEFVCLEVANTKPQKIPPKGMVTLAQTIKIRC